MADDWGASVDEQEQGLTETVSTVKLQWLRHQAQCCPHVQYSKTFVKWPLSKRPQICFQDQLSLNAGQKYCRMLPL